MAAGTRLDLADLVSSVSPLLRRVLRDPLLHFVVAGTALFWLLPGESDPGSTRITVNRAQLIEFMQGKARIYDAASFAEAYDALPPAERRQLLDEYVRAEALYREALATGLDEADPLVRSRLVQQMDLLLRDSALSGTRVSDAEVEAYFRDNAASYARAATASFTHVFIDGDRRGAAAEAIAARELQALRQGDVAPEDALERGDRFPYQRNYSVMTGPALVPEMGEAVAAAVFAVPPGQWSGPYRSPLGYHLVRVASRTPAQAAALEPIRAIVTRDALATKRDRLGEEAVARAIASYQVAPAGDIGALE